MLITYLMLFISGILGSAIAWNDLKDTPNSAKQG